MASGDTKTESYLRAAAEGTRADLPSDTCCNTKTQNLILGVAERIMDVEDEVEELKNNPDVVDIVDTYQDLQAYDTSTLTDKDIIRVLEDSTHNNSSTFYRWNASTNQFDYIGEVSGGVNVVQTIGTSTTDVMSQKAVTDELYNSNNRERVQIGLNASSTGGSYFSSLAIGRGAQATAQQSTAIGSMSPTANAKYSTAIGYMARGTNEYVTVIGSEAQATYKGAVALGAFSNPSAIGEVNIGSTNASYGYDSTKYRLLTGLYDPQNAHDAATKGYVDANAGGGSTAVYISMPLFEATSSVSPSDPLVLYKDAAMTQPFSAAEIDSMSAGLDNIIMLYTDGSEYTERYSMNSITIDSTDLYWYITHIDKIYSIDFGGSSHSGALHVRVVQ